MLLTSLAIRRPIVIGMALIAILVLGLVAYSRLPAELNPRVPIPTITVITVYPGAGPAEVEDQVTRPIEEAVATASGIRNVYSSSQDSVSIVSIDFRVGINVDNALAAVRDRADTARASLPQGAQSPIVAKLDINAQPVVYAALTAAGSLEDLGSAVERDLKPRLARVPGVASVTVTGGKNREALVEVCAASLMQHGITVEDVLNAVRGSGTNVPAGSVSGGGSETAVRTMGAFRSLDDIAAAPILTFGSMAADLMPDLPIPGLPRRSAVPDPITVGDVANLSFQSQDEGTFSRLDGRPCIGVVVAKSPDANALAVADGVRRELEGAIGSILPDDSAVAVLRDESGVIRDALHDVNTTLVLGAILAVTVVLAFLRNLRGTVIVAVALPACFFATYMVIYFAGFTLNQMTLLALSLSVGILVDDSIVVLESITRHLGLGERPAEAAFNGRTEIGFAGIVLTLADVVVFLPIAFMGGIVGAFFREFGLTVAFATLFSLIVSFTVTPALASRWYRPGERLATHGTRFDGLYGRALSWALQRPGWTIGWGATALAAVFLVAAPNLGFEFLPASDQGQIAITVELPPGSSRAATDATARRIERQLAGMPDVRHAMTTVGEIVGGFGSIPQRGSQYAQINVRLNDRAGWTDRLSGSRRSARSRFRSRTDTEVAEAIRRSLRDISDARIVVAPVRTVANIGPALQIELSGHDLDAVAEAARTTRDAVADIPGVIEADTSLRPGQPELQAIVDRTRAAALGIPPSLAGSVVRTAMTGVEAGRIAAYGRDMPVRIRLQEADRQNADALDAIPIGLFRGRPVLLGDVARLELRSGPTAIERVNGMRLATVFAELAPGYALGNVSSEVERRLTRALPDGVAFRFGGESGVLEENLPHFVLAGALAVVLLYLVAAALFNSMLYPLVMMVTLPMALIGGLGALVIMGETLSLVSMIGVIMLIGLMGRNAILLIDYTNTLRARGLSRTDALREAGIARLRPILMTTLTTIFGMLPVALRIGRAAELRAPMAIVVIGGLVVSTLLTLVVVPVAYDMADRLRSKH